MSVNTVDIHNYTCSNIGLLLPAINEYTWNDGLRAFLYLIGMLWCFLAVALQADTFMCGIERITSKTRIIKVAHPEMKHTVQEIEVPVWNATVANLTLMAFGTSAPEILLSVIEIVGNGLKPGQLGPGTIVGSAAFNMFVITGICIVSIPKGETRRLSTLSVYLVTSCFSIFAYVWLIVVLKGSSPGRVDVWEAVVTFLMFPLLIITAFLADKKFCCKSKTSTEVEIGLDVTNTDRRKSTINTADIIEACKEAQRDPKLTEEDAAKIAVARLSEHTSHSSLWYRINATRSITGSVKLVPNVKRAVDELYEETIDKRTADTLKSPDVINGDKAVVEFTAATCAVLESEGKVRIGIKRSGLKSKPISVWVETIDGSATAESDYKPIKQMIRFEAGEMLKDIYIEIIDDDVWEPDEFFFVKLFCDPTDDTDDVVLGRVAINQVTIVNDDEPGKFEFAKPSYIVKESLGKAQLTVQRVNGADGNVSVTWKTEDMTAENKKDYVGGTGTLKYAHGETSKMLEIPVINHQQGERDQNFQVELNSPTAGSEIGKIGRTIVTVINDDDFNGMVNRVTRLTKNNLNMIQLDTSSWAEQLRNAMNVNGGDVENATRLDYVMHFLAFFWKIVNALIPPPSIGGGWLTFIISLAMIGAMTAIIGDLAKVFGCLVGLSETITAITLVALGTSMPDTFASKQAAVCEKHADSSIGNINGSNSVNVFLGIGLPWTIAAIYWESKNEIFEVKAGSLGFSVTLYTACALMGIIFLMVRRSSKTFGQAELGGPIYPKIISCLLFFSLWIIYIVLSSLQAQGVMDVGF